MKTGTGNKRPVPGPTHSHTGRRRKTSQPWPPERGANRGEGGGGYRPGRAEPGATHVLCSPSPRADSGPLQTLPRSPLRRPSPASTATPPNYAPLRESRHRVLINRRPAELSSGASTQIPDESLFATARFASAQRGCFHTIFSHANWSGPHRTLFQQLDLITRRRGGGGQPPPVRARAKTRSPPSKKGTARTQGLFLFPTDAKKKKKKRKNNNKHTPRHEHATLSSTERVNAHLARVPEEEKRRDKSSDHQHLYLLWKSR